jgi:MraZ protein
MLIGEYLHTIDEKNRVSVPFKFRKELGKKIIITPGLDNCLFIFNLNEWSRITKKLSGNDNELSFLKKDQRSFNRNLFGQASDMEIDRIGRILIPEFLKEKIKLGSNAVLVGVEDRVEVWNEKTWKEYKNRSERQMEELAEKLANA